MWKNAINIPGWYCKLCLGIGQWLSITMTILWSWGALIACLLEWWVVPLNCSTTGMSLSTSSNRFTFVWLYVSTHLKWLLMLLTLYYMSLFVCRSLMVSACRCMHSGNWSSAQTFSNACRVLLHDRLHFLDRML